MPRWGDERALVEFTIGDAAAELVKEELGGPIDLQVWACITCREPLRVFNGRIANPDEVNVDIYLREHVWTMTVHTPGCKDSNRPAPTQPHRRFYDPFKGAP